MKSSFLLQALMLAILWLPTTGYAQAVQAQPNSGLSMHEVVAEAGPHPDRLEGEIQKLLTIDGRAFWIKTTPVFSSGVHYVEILNWGPDRVQFQLYLTKDAQKLLRKYSRKYSSNRPTNEVVLVLDGLIVSGPVRIVRPLNVIALGLPPMSRSEGMLLMLEFQRANIPTAVQK